jgi:protease-4
VEKRRSGGFDPSTFQPPSLNKRNTIVLETKELVEIIHEAASDPNVSAVYADFGEGMRYVSAQLYHLSIMHHVFSNKSTVINSSYSNLHIQPLQYAHIEEIRSAIRIFNESHRVHRSPNVDHNPVFAMSRNSDPKSSYAFGHSFGWREYFLASAFTNVCLQPRGHLNLGGAVMMNLFVGDMFHKYGIKAHVFKHGNYKSESPRLHTILFVKLHRSQAH